MPTPKGKPSPKKIPMRMDLRSNDKPSVTDTRRATDAELTAVLTTTANDFNRALKAAKKAGLVIRAEMQDPTPASNDDTPQDARTQAMTPVEITEPRLVNLIHVGRTYL